MCKKVKLGFMEAWNHSFSIGEFNPNSLTYHSATKGENKSGIINTTKNQEQNAYRAKNQSKPQTWMITCKKVKLGFMEAWNHSFYIAWGCSTQKFSGSCSPKKIRHKDSVAVADQNIISLSPKSNMWSTAFTCKCTNNHKHIWHIFSLYIYHGYSKEDLH